jgi:uncharacterized NAD-dependent epimerase/dehydratase family protein
MTLELPTPYLLFLGDLTDPVNAKTAFGLRDWAREQCIGECALPSATVSTGLPRLSAREGYRQGARSLVIGVAPVGGTLALTWIPALVEALEAGLHLISGMHGSLSDIPALKQASDRLGRRLIDVRRPPPNLPIATGRKRTGHRLLTVGTDCALGKKYTALALTRAFRMQGVDAEFRATGQTGILIAGAGIPIDATVADFMAGAAEVLTPDAAPSHWDVVEGQGSIFHPAYSGVSLALLHGTQPDALVVCHSVDRVTLARFEEYPIPSLEDAIDLHVRLARRVNSRARCAGIALNTSTLPSPEAQAVMAECSARLGLPVADPIRGGPEFELLVANCLAES